MHYSFNPIYTCLAWILSLHLPFPTCSASVGRLRRPPSRLCQRRTWRWRAEDGDFGVEPQEPGVGGG